MQCNGFYFFQDITSERATFHIIIHNLEPCLRNNFRIQYLFLLSIKGPKYQLLLDFTIIFLQSLGVWFTLFIYYPINYCIVWNSFPDIFTYICTAFLIFSALLVLECHSRYKGRSNRRQTKSSRWGASWYSLFTSCYWNHQVNENESRMEIKWDAFMNMLEKLKETYRLEKIDLYWIIKLNWI